MLFNDIFSLEVLILLSALFYTCSTNLLILLYTGFLYLMLTGTLSLINDADIYIGFLWVIDLGVGLVFFIFILHFTSFLFQKSYFNLSARHFFTLTIVTLITLLVYYFLSNPTDNSFNGDLLKTWFFKITHMDYYLIYNSSEVTDLNTLRDAYFCLNGFEFFIVNFSLLFGLLASILICFLIQRIFNYLNYSQIINYRVLHANSSGFTIRNQNFTTQQSMFSGVNQWSKTK